MCQSGQQLVKEFQLSEIHFLILEKNLWGETLLN